MAREARILAGPGIRVVHAGGSPARLRALLDAGTQPHCAAIVSFGIAGGLDPDLEPGEVIVATGLFTGGKRLPTDPRLAERLGRALTAGGLAPILADLLGVDEAVADVGRKAALHRQTGAAAVDMESHVAIAHAVRRGVPFAAIRVVCDPAARSLPRVAAEALRPDGTVDGFGLALGLLRDPRQITGLIRLAGDARIGFRALGRCRAVLGAGLGLTTD